MYRLRENFKAIQFTESMKSVKEIKEMTNSEASLGFGEEMVLMLKGTRADGLDSPTFKVDLNSWVINGINGLEVLTDDKFKERYERVRKSRAKEVTNG